MAIRIRVRPKGAHDTSEDTVNVGSAKTLCGRIFVLSVFVAPHHNPWRVADIERQKQKVFEAERWLRMQALRYGKDVEFVNAAFGADGSFLDDDIPVGGHTRNSYYYAGNILRKMGFSDPQDFVRWTRCKAGCPQCLTIVFPNTCGRSFASPVSRRLHSHNPVRYNLEGCIVYRKDDEGCTHETNPATVAHEMLHLFGAWDLYELDSGDRNRADKTALMFPNSIMLRTHCDIWQLQIDEINAWLVGLRDAGKDWYRWFEPHKDDYESG